MTITLTRSEFDAASAKLLKQGILLTGDKGSVTHNGVTIDFAYFGDTLTLDVVKKPFLVSEGILESTIRKWFSQEG